MTSPAMDYRQLDQSLQLLSDLILSGTQNLKESLDVYTKANCIHQIQWLADIIIYATTCVSNCSVTNMGLLLPCILQTVLKAINT